MHIEIVPKLDIDSFLNAIMRFVARRGKPVKMISDTGTNFVGGEREFTEYIAAWNKERIEESMTQQGKRIRWNFRQPAAPDLGEWGKDWPEIVRRKCMPWWPIVQLLKMFSQQLLVLLSKQ